MQKIPTLFERGDDHRVTPKWRDECLWVRDGEGVATEKLDGTNVAVANDYGFMHLLKRRNPSKAEKAAGAEPRYVPARRDDPADRHIYDAYDNARDAGMFTALAGVDVMGSGNHNVWLISCEAIGPKIQGNPLCLEQRILVRLDVAHLPTFYATIPRSFEGLADLFRSVEPLESRYSPPHAAEGIVFHHVDGRMAKIKAKDFAR